VSASVACRITWAQALRRLSHRVDRRVPGHPPENRHLILEAATRGVRNAWADLFVGQAVFQVSGRPKSELA
jgi:hypothetical protein